MEDGGDNDDEGDIGAQAKSRKWPLVFLVSISFP